QDRPGARRVADAGRDRPRARASRDDGARQWRRDRARHRAAGDHRAYRRMGEEGGRPRLRAGADHHGGDQGEVKLPPSGPAWPRPSTSYSKKGRKTWMPATSAGMTRIPMPPYESLPYRP